MARVDARISDAIGEVAIIGGVSVPGHFTEGYREIELADGSATGVHRTFDCRYTAEVAALGEGDMVEVPDHGTFRFLQRIPDRGDQSGWVHLVLGSNQP